MSQLSFTGFGKEPEETPPEIPVEVAPWYKGRVLSHSSISTFRSCPLKWKFRYVDKVPDKPRSFFSFGKSVHAGLEFLLEKREERPTLEQLIEHYRANWLREGYETPAQEKWFFQEGDRILRGYFAKHGADNTQVLQVELKFTISVEGIPVMGYIDRVDNTPRGGLAIVDYKTGMAFDKSRVRTDPQLTLYQMACTKLFNKPVETVTLYHLNSLTPLTVPAHSSKLEDDVKAAVLEAARGINDQNFEAKPDERGVCKYCDYAQICPALAAVKKTVPSASASSPMSVLADRYGKIESRIRELKTERDEMADSLKAHMKISETTRVEGTHYSVEMNPDASAEPILQAKPVPSTESLPS